MKKRLSLWILNYLIIMIFWKSLDLRKLTQNKSTEISLSVAVGVGSLDPWDLQITTSSVLLVCFMFCCSIQR